MQFKWLEPMPELVRLAVALAIGLLTGLERGWERRELHTAQRTAGLRTFGAIGLLGGITAELGGALSASLIGAIAVALGLVLAAGYWRESEIDRDVSLTTSVTALVTYGLGALAGRGELLAASSSAVVLALLLGFRPELHDFIRQIDRDELLATFRLLLISLVLLPVLPNRDLGPWALFNPYHIWLMVVMVAGISYAGYIAMRFFGTGRGILVTGLCGGLASSTMVALSLARRAAEGLGVPNLLAAGATIASAIMWPRILLIVGAVDPAFAWRLAWPIGLATVAAVTSALILAWMSTVEERALRSGGEKLQTGNPLDLATAIRFGLILTAILAASRAASAWAGSYGLIAVAGLAGLIDVDAISLSVANLSIHHLVTPTVAAGAIVLAAVVNTMLKAAVALWIGGTPMGLRFLAASLAMAVACGAGWLIVLRF